MRNLTILLTHFAALLQCTQANAAKAYIAKELQTYAATSSRIAINFIVNFINKTKTNNLYPPTTQLILAPKFNLTVSKYTETKSDQPP